eukprot:SAG11_NODE_2504_length_3274_cov_5.227888_1_plen_435_part_00
MRRVQIVIRPFLSANTVLEDWMVEWCTAAQARHPKSRTAYTIPYFRLLLKVHKKKLDGRPITGNHCWCTQPYAQLVAWLCNPYVRCMSTYVKDSDHMNRDLLTQQVASSFLLVTFDVVRLYPSIPHILCWQLVFDYLRECQSPFAYFVRAVVIFTLLQNYCQFDGAVYRQVIGFATGVSFGTQIADIFLHMLFRGVYARYADCIHMIRRFVDDGFMIWSGTVQQLEDFFRELNACNEHISVTHEISDSSAIFLDLFIWKGPQWRLTGVLDTTVFEKAIARHLFVPGNSEHPRHVIISIMRSACNRFLKRCSGEGDYCSFVCAMYDHMRVRGHSPDVLKMALAGVPAYSTQARLRALGAIPSTPPTSSSLNNAPVLAFSTVYSHQRFRAGLARALFLRRHMLPRLFDGVRFITAWRAAPKIGRRLIAYKFSSARI